MRWQRTERLSTRGRLASRDARMVHTPGNPQAEFTMVELLRALVLSALGVLGTQVEVFVDCNHVLTYDDPELWLSGRYGLRTYATSAYFDEMGAVAWDGVAP